MGYIILSLVAICPVLFYIFYINAFDHRKPEPPKALTISALLGIITAAVVLWSTDVSVLYIGNGCSFKESFSIGFLKLALPSEIAKWLVLCVFLSLNRFYDEYVDGIIYSVCLSMGFAGIWGAWFFSSYLGESFASLLEISAITVFVLTPLHFISGTIMGYYLALARKRNKNQNHALALFLSILTDGLISSVVMLIGHRWEYYFAVGMALTILAMVVYTQIFHLLELDGEKTER